MNLKKAVGKDEFEKSQLQEAMNLKKAVGNHEFKKKLQGTMNLKKGFDNFCNSRF